MLILGQIYDPFFPFQPQKNQTSNLCPLFNAHHEVQFQKYLMKRFREKLVLIKDQ